MIQECKLQPLCTVSKRKHGAQISFLPSTMRPRPWSMNGFVRDVFVRCTHVFCTWFNCPNHRSNTWKNNNQYSKEDTSLLDQSAEWTESDFNKVVDGFAQKQVKKRRLLQSDRPQCYCVFLAVSCLSGSIWSILWWSPNLGLWWQLIELLVALDGKCITISAADK